MSWLEIKRRLRRIEFNMTEPEVLRELIASSEKVGTELRETNRTLTGHARRIATELYSGGWVREVAPDPNLADEMGYIGIDGSSYPIEGLSGEYHVPTSAACVIFQRGMQSTPEIIVGAEIFEVSERESGRFGKEVTLQMLAMETKLLLETVQNLPALAEHTIMLDGPIVDPPWNTDEEYVRMRCDAIKLAVSKGAQVLGVVKSPREVFIRDALKSQSENSCSGLLMAYKTDLHLMAHVFNSLRTRLQTASPIATSAVELTGATGASTPYMSQGVRIFSLFFQNTKRSRPLRVDWCRTSDSALGIDDEQDKIGKLMATTSFPGLPYPLPVFLAHKKCSIRRGCAEVLFQDIMTRARTSSEEEAVMLEIMRGRT